MALSDWRHPRVPQSYPAAGKFRRSVLLHKHCRRSVARVRTSVRHWAHDSRSLRRHRSVHWTTLRHHEALVYIELRGEPKRNVAFYVSRNALSCLLANVSRLVCVHCSKPIFIVCCSSTVSLNGSSSPVITATSRSYGDAKNSTPTESKPLI